MKHAPDLAAVARRVKAAQDEVRRIEPLLSQSEGIDLAAAYEVADLVHRARIEEGARPLGRKIGFTNPDMWRLYGVSEPIWAYVYDTTVVHLSGHAGECSLARLVEPRIEPEIVFCLHTAPPAGAGPQALLGCIEWVAHAFEIVQSHAPGWRFTAPDAVMDGALHGMLLLGAPQPPAALGDDPIATLERFTVELSCDGATRAAGRGSNVLGQPLTALAHLVAVLDRQPGYPPLQAGEIVTTGTVTVAPPVHPGETWRTRLEGIALPGLCVEFFA